ncbi:hypothetical protein M885DRAFT_531836 [Pelagophyceae sp. CCMP2097]|nr:hypothetical protein M885DRAFT_531836 [Pelagophyceae sp. CCMP2097]
MAAPARRRLVQTLVVNGVGEVLLVKWKEGPCEGKYTGCLGDADGSDEQSAVNVVEQLTGLRLDERRLLRVAEFVFEDVYEYDSADDDSADDADGGVDDADVDVDDADGGIDGGIESCDEIEFVYRATRGECAGRKDCADCVSAWVKLEDVPYNEMPADDALWYPAVLLQGKTLTGRFRFQGDALLEHEIREATADEVRR